MENIEPQKEQQSNNPLQINDTPHDIKYTNSDKKPLKTSNSDATTESFNKFILRDIFPEAHKLFSNKIYNIDQIKENCLVVLDTNVLLMPYKVGSNSLTEIGSVYKSLASNKRIYIPVQILREFASNRGTKLGESFQKLLDFKSKITNNYKLENNLLLENLAEYKDIKSLEIEIKNNHIKYITMLDSLINHIKGFSWNDPVSVMYNEIFSNNAIDVDLSDEVVEADLIKRNKYNIPPGYKDKGKSDSGIGDLLIWHTILRLGKELKQNLIFVTHDSKPDWWQKGAGQPLYARYELIDEYRRSSDGKTFQMSNFSDFLSMFNVNQDVIEEVKNKEDTENNLTDNKLTNEDNKNLIEETYMLVNEIKKLINKVSQQSSEARYARSYRVIWVNAANEYKEIFRSRAIDLRNRLLAELSIELDDRRERLYLQHHANDYTAVELEGITNDLLLLTAQLIDFKY